MSFDPWKLGSDDEDEDAYNRTFKDYRAFFIIRLSTTSRHASNTTETMLHGLFQDYRGLGIPAWESGKEDLLSGGTKQTQVVVDTLGLFHRRGACALLQKRAWPSCGGGEIARLGWRAIPEGEGG